MKVICVDDERLLMEDTVSLCQELAEIEEVKGFTRPGDALAWLDRHSADLVLLDIDMPDINGIELAARIKEKWPQIAVIFLTGFPQYAVDAFAVRASGYILKPVTKEMLERDVAYVFSLKPDNKDLPKIFIRTFGNFDVFVDGKAILFKMAKCKELLAYLVDRQGSSVTRAEVSAILWEDRFYDRKMQKQLDVYIRSLRETLREYGIENILEMNRGTLRVNPDTFSCDAYSFFAGDSRAINSYRGEYMTSYSWASMTESVMYWTRWK